MSETRFSQNAMLNLGDPLVTDALDRCAFRNSASVTFVVAPPSVAVLGGRAGARPAPLLYESFIPTPEPPPVPDVELDWSADLTANAVNLAFTDNTITGGAGSDALPYADGDGVLVLDAGAGNETRRGWYTYAAGEAPAVYVLTRIVDYEVADQVLGGYRTHVVDGDRTYITDGDSVIGTDPIVFVEG